MKNCNAPIDTMKKQFNSVIVLLLACFFFSTYVQNNALTYKISEVEQITKIENRQAFAENFIKKTKERETLHIEKDMRLVSKVLKEKGYNIYSAEYNEGHSWGLWRATLDDLLMYLVPRK